MPGPYDRYLALKRQWAAGARNMQCRTPSFAGCPGRGLEFDCSARVPHADVPAPDRSFGAHALASLTVENYLKTIYQICAEQSGKPAATGQLAAALAVSPGTVTSMLKTLSDSKLATYTPYEGAKLTTAGRSLALRILRRHRLIELFLTRTLDLTWDEVHDEAENMEHAVSDLLVDRIDAYLGYPPVDPHGDPIPRADGSLVERGAADAGRMRGGREIPLCPRHRSIA